MAYKLGLLLSAAFMMCVLLLGGDLYSIYAVHAKLDSLATTVSYRVAKNGQVDSATKRFVQRAGVTLTVLSSLTPRVGDIFNFELSQEYSPLIVSKETMVITVQRSTVVGFYETNL